MGLHPTIKRHWAKIQQQYDYPVDLRGRPINKDDATTIKLWTAGGIDLYMLPEKPSIKRN